MAPREMDFSSTRTQHSLDDIKLMLVGGNKKSALQSMWHETRRLQDELADLAQEASSHSVSKVTVAKLWSGSQGQQALSASNLIPTKLFGR